MASKQPTVKDVIYACQYGGQMLRTVVAGRNVSYVLHPSGIRVSKPIGDEVTRKHYKEIQDAQR